MKYHTQPNAIQSDKPKLLSTRDELHRTFGGYISSYDLEPGNHMYITQSANKVMHDLRFDETCKQNIINRDNIKKQQIKEI